MTVCASYFKYYIFFFISLDDVFVREVDFNLKEPKEKGPLGFRSFKHQNRGISRDCHLLRLGNENLLVAGGAFLH